MNRIIATVHRTDKTSIKNRNPNVATLELTHRLVAFGTTGGELADSTAPTAPAAMEVDGVLHLILAGKEDPVDQLDHDKNNDYRTCKKEALLQGIVAENNNVQVKIHIAPNITKIDYHTTSYLNKRILV
jgi:hypothetical protein